MVAPMPLGIWPLELKGHEELEELGNRDANLFGQVSTTKRTLMSFAPANKF